MKPVKPGVKPRDCEPASLITVIVPSYNAEETLEETLASISGQSYGNLEILIVDDGSTDSTAAIAAQFCRMDGRARLLRKENGGVASARNLGIAEARGTYLAPIDADDLWHPDHLLCALETIRKTQSAMVFSLYRTIDMASNVVRSGPRFDVNGLAVHRMAYYNLVGNGSALLIDREVALAVDGYDCRLHAAGMEGCEDYLIQLRIAAKFPIACVEKCHVGYRSRSNAMSSDAERMCQSMEMANDLFRESELGLDIPHYIWRWSRARDLMRLARYRLLRGGVFRGAGSLMTAMRLDLIGTLVAMHHDVHRVTARVLGGPPAPPDIHFLAADPLETIGAPAFGRQDRPNLLARLEHGRMRHMARLDGADGLATAVLRPTGRFDQVQCRPGLDRHPRADVDACGAGTE